MNPAITIGNATPESIGAWMIHNFPSLGFSALPMVGGWEGQLEPSVMLILWAAEQEQADDVLDTYAAEHPDEAYFGTFPMPASNLVPNPAHAAHRNEITS